MNRERARHLSLFKEWKHVWSRVPKSVRKGWARKDAEVTTMEWLSQDLFRGEWFLGLRLVPVQVKYEFENSAFVGFCIHGVLESDRVPMMAMLTHVLREMQLREDGLGYECAMLPVTAKYVEGGRHDMCGVVGKGFLVALRCFVEVLAIVMLPSEHAEQFLEPLSGDIAHVREVTLFFVYGVCLCFPFSLFGLVMTSVFFGNRDGEKSIGESVDQKDLQR